MNPTNRLDNLLKERKEVQETQNEIVKNSKYEVILNFNPFHELSIDNYLQNYLIDKSKELINLQVNDAIKMGKILEEVSQELFSRRSIWKFFKIQWNQFKNSIKAKKKVYFIF